MSRWFVLLPFATFGCGVESEVKIPAQNTAAPEIRSAEKPPVAIPEVAAIRAEKEGEYVTIKGQVTWPGAIPKLVPIPGNGAAAGCCPPNVPLLPTDVLVDPKTLGLKNVVVLVRPDNGNRKDTFPQKQIHPDLLNPKSKEHVIDQPQCQFEPRILVARAGDTLTVKNSSALPHNVNYNSDIEQINPLIPAGGFVKLQKPFEAQNTPITVACNIHPWMGGRVRVFDHPYYAITDQDGNFEIKNVPAGKWRLVYWHELGTHQGKEGILGSPVDVAKPEKGNVQQLKPVAYQKP